MSSLAAFFFSFIPPGQIPVGSPAVYIGILIVGALIFVAIPMVIYSMRKPDWADPRAKAEFEPFGWENKKLQR
ncbi:MAG: hypothetical protein IKL98_07945 [Akkermansia sp.]|nr:hypothetical protein [Akkermansia sp.]